LDAETGLFTFKAQVPGEFTITYVNVDKDHSVCFASSYIDSEATGGSYFIMLKNISYEGTYSDEDITISAVLKNPSDCSLNENDLAFSVFVKGKHGDNAAPHMDDFVFYVIDDNYCIFNMQLVPYTDSLPATLPFEPQDDEPKLMPSGIIYMELRPAFIFHDLRVAFYYRRYERVEIIKLQRC